MILECCELETFLRPLVDGGACMRIVPIHYTYPQLDTQFLRTESSVTAEANAYSKLLTNIFEKIVLYVASINNDLR